MQMSKEEFLNGLQMALNGALPQGKILEHVSYYRNYIESQVRNGRSEEAVTAELGAPQLIAKTLLDTDDGSYQKVYEEDYDVAYGQEENDYRDSYVKKHTYKLDFTTWYGKLIAIAAAIAFIALLVFIIGTVVPIILIVCLVMYVISYIKKRR